MARPRKKIDLDNYVCFIAYFQEIFANNTLGDYLEEPKKMAKMVKKFDGLPTVRYCGLEGTEYEIIELDALNNWCDELSKKGWARLTSRETTRRHTSTHKIKSLNVDGATHKRFFLLAKKYQVDSKDLLNALLTLANKNKDALREILRHSLNGQ